MITVCDTASASELKNAFQTEGNCAPDVAFERSSSTKSVRHRKRKLSRCSRSPTSATSSVPAIASKTRPVASRSPVEAADMWTRL